MFFPGEEKDDLSQIAAKVELDLAGSEENGETVFEQWATQMEGDVTELEPGDSWMINDVSSPAGDQTVAGDAEFAGGSFEDDVSSLVSGELDDGVDLREGTDLDGEDVTFTPKFFLVTFTLSFVV